MSAGGFIAAGLVNGYTPHLMSRLFIEGHRSDERFDPAILLRPALKEYWRRVASLPPLMWSALWHYASGPSSLLSSVERLGRGDPDRMFNGDEIDKYLARVFSQPGRSNDFRKLAHKLFLVATELDTGEAHVFGTPGTEHIPVSRAVQASAALPGVFPPVEIEGRYFVDGALRKTLHASVALEEGIDLLLCLNPLVPYDAAPGPRARDRAHRMSKLVEGGCRRCSRRPTARCCARVSTPAWSATRRPTRDTDIVLFEPNRFDADMFFTNLFSYSSRRRLCEHAYQKTRHELWTRRHELAPVLARHGVTIDVAMLRDESMTLIKSIRRQDDRWIETATSAATRQLGTRSMISSAGCVRALGARQGKPAITS